MSTQVEELKDWFEKFETNIKGQLSDVAKQEVAAALDGSTEFASAQTVKEQAQLIEEVLNKVRKIDDNAHKPELMDVKTFIEKNKDQLKALRVNPSAELFVPETVVTRAKMQQKITEKAVMTRAGVDNGPWTFDIDGIGQIARPRPTLWQRIPKINMGEGMDGGTARYLDQDPATVTINATAEAAPVGENAAFPEETYGLTLQTRDLKKVGTRLPVTEEFFEDYNLAAQEIDLFLTGNMENAIDNQVINGTGVGDQLTGWVTDIPAYVPAAAGNAPANLLDLIFAVRLAINLVGNMNYDVNFCALNPSDAYALQTRKAGDGHYTFPEMVFQNGINPRGVEILEDPRIPANTMYVGDINFARIYEKGGITLSAGYHDGDFISDRIQLKARKRMASLIRLVDRQAFRRVTNITTALTTIGG